MDSFFSTWFQILPETSTPVNCILSHKCLLVKCLGQCLWMRNFFFFGCFGVYLRGGQLTYWNELLMNLLVK